MRSWGGPPVRAARVERRILDKLPQTEKMSGIKARYKPVISLLGHCRAMHPKCPLAARASCVQRLSMRPNIRPLPKQTFYIERSRGFPAIHLAPHDLLHCLA